MSVRKVRRQVESSVWSFLYFIKQNMYSVLPKQLRGQWGPWAGKSRGPITQFSASGPRLSALLQTTVNVDIFSLLNFRASNPVTFSRGHIFAHFVPNSIHLK